MARRATTSDPFNAIAEPRRRAILAMLCEGEFAVNDLVDSLGYGQPSVSKHLRVLRKVDLVTVRRAGQRRFYSANQQALEPVRTWMVQIERLWDHNLAQIKQTAEAQTTATPTNPKD